MRIRLDILRRFTALPDDPAAARVLLDEVGIEVKRFDPSAPGVTMTLELLANRGDHHACEGLAREVAARTGLPLTLPPRDELPVGALPHPIRIETELCPIYALTRFEREREGALGPDSLALLEASGLASKGAVVDATNVAQLELGQPTHAFDADKVVGTVVVRLSRPGERAWPLFRSDPVELPEGTIVIADDVKVLAIAGVIGCEESKTTEATRAVLLESAAFDPVAVRKASRALDIHTDSSARFERGSDFARVVPGVGRVSLLLREAGWVIRGEVGLVSRWRDPCRTIPFDPAAARRFLAVEASDAELAQRLERQGFRVAPDGTFDVRTGEPLHPERLGVLVPTWRLWDVEHPADLYEDLARSFGYDNTPIGLPSIDMGQLPSREESVRAEVEEILLGNGFYEVITDGFYSRQLRERCLVSEGHPLWAHVETANALDRGYSLLKNNALFQAIDAAAVNAAVRTEAVKAWEWTRTFHPDVGAANGTCTERRVLWALASGGERPDAWAGRSRPADAWFFKGIVGEIAVLLGQTWEFARPDGDHPLSTLLHPGRTLLIRRAGQTIGVLGEVHPAVIASFKLKRARPVYLEIDEEALYVPGRTQPYVEPFDRQPIDRDLAFTVPFGFEAARVVSRLQEAGPSWLRSVRITDRFDHEAEGQPVVTWTFALSFSTAEADRTTEEMNAVCEGMIAAVHGAFGSLGVRLR